MDKSIIYIIVVAILLLPVIVLTFYRVNQQCVAIIERFGRFVRLGHPGLNLKIPAIESIAGYINLRIQQMDVCIDTKTKDNVFVKIVISVQYCVLKNKVYDAFYKLTDPKTQIESFVFDVVRAQVPAMLLDTVFENKDSVANAVRAELTEMMADFGYGIVKALVTDIDPDAKVKAAMNEINEQQRLRMAAQERAEAEKILKVKQAEAEAESMQLRGQGIANERKAIIEGLSDSIDEFKSANKDINAPDVMSLVLLTQYYDTLKEIGMNNNSNTILLPHTPSGVSDITQQLQEGTLVGNLLSQHS